MVVKEVMEEREVGHCRETQVTDHHHELSRMSKGITIETETEKVGERDSQAKEILTKDLTDIAAPEDTVVQLTQEVDHIQDHLILSLELSVITHTYSYSPAVLSQSLLIVLS